MRPPTTGRPPASPATRDALLCAAGEVFAESGFAAARVRDICRRAGANVAAVNYHFGDKKRLYLEVLQHAQRVVRERYPFDRGVTPQASAEARLRAFVVNLLRRVLGSREPSWLGRLMAREMIAPTHAFETMVREHIVPMADVLRGIIESLGGKRLDAEAVRLLGCSVVSQCVFYHHCRTVVCRLFPHQRFDPEGVEKMATHITAFSLAGIRAAARRAERPGASAPESVRVHV